MDMLKQTIIVCGTSIALYACASTPLHEPPEINFDAFTTVGKPTKTVMTDWGTFELYDPIQDPEVQRAFDYVYTRGVRYDKAKSNDPTIETDLKPYIDFFDKIENIQINDLARSGCRGPTINICQSDGILQRDLKQCSTLDWGSPKLNDCEVKNIEFVPHDYADVPLGRVGETCYEPDINFTRLYKRPDNLDYKESYLSLSRKESFENHFSRSCIVYSEIRKETSL